MRYRLNKETREWEEVVPVDWDRKLEADPGPYVYATKTIGPFFSRSLPRNWKYHKGKFNEGGQPLFEGKKAVRETVARANDDGDNVSYGEL